MSLQLRAAKHQLADLKRISELGVDRLVSVQQKLDELEKPALRPSDLLAVVEEVLGENAEPLVRQLLSLQGLVRQTGLSVDEVFTGIRGAVEQQGEQAGIDIEAWARVEDIVKGLVQARSVRLAAKAIELVYDYANLLRRSQMLTDVRPLFNKDADAIEGAVVSYTLRLHYDTADGEHELSIALDESDVKKLADQCNRALVKAATLRAFLAEKCGVSVIVPGEVNDA